MGLIAPVLEKLASIVRANPSAGKSLLVLGRQDVNVDAGFFEKHAGVLVDADAGWVQAAVADGRHREAFDVIFRALGYGTIDVLDACAYEGANLIVDLNVPIPEGDHPAYDLVLDLGTCEHVFDVRTTFANLIRLTAVGGSIIHFAPLNDWPDHGFYCFSPNLFRSVYEANGFELDELRIYRVDDGNPPRWTWFRYHDRMLSDPLANREKSLRGRFGVFCRARKVQAVTAFVIPQQAIYEQVLWRPDQAQLGAIIAHKVALVRQALGDLFDAPGAAWAVYGDGTHTRLLLEAWAVGRGKPPAAIITTSGPRDLSARPPRLAVEEIEDGRFDFIVISSRRFEQEIYASTRSRFTRTRVICLYPLNLEQAFPGEFVE